MRRAARRGAPIRKIALGKAPAQRVILHTTIAEDELRHGLLRIIDTPRLRSDTRIQASKLLADLSRPARVLIKGGGETYQRGLLAALLPKAPLPADLPSGTYLVRYGEPAEFPAMNQDAAPALPATLPLHEPGLKEINFLIWQDKALKTSGYGALSSASAFAEICIWACDEFHIGEALLWHLALKEMTAEAFLVAPNLPELPAGFLAQFDPESELASLAKAVISCAKSARLARFDRAALFLRRYLPREPDEASAEGSTKGTNRTGSPDVI